MTIETLLIYSAVAFFYIISPGSAVFLAIYNGAVQGVRCVIASALGNILGILFLSTVSISGLSAILLSSAVLFTIVKIVGAAYLVYLGFKQLRSTSTMQKGDDTAATVDAKTGVSHFKEGLFVAVTNPKPIIFFAALFPQFLNTDAPVLPQFVIMTLIFMLFSFLSLSCYGYLAQRANGLLANAENVKWFHRISGGLFIGMGVSLFHFKSAN